MSTPVSLATNLAGMGIAGLYSAPAASYDRSYAVPGHRRVYDLPAWEMMTALPRPEGAHVVDVGCGTGCRAERLLSLGCRATGIKTAPGVNGGLDRRSLGQSFTLLRQPMDRVDLPDGSAGLPDIDCRGLAIGATALGPDAFGRAASADGAAVMTHERLSCAEDRGLHLLAIVRKPGAA